MLDVVEKYLKKLLLDIVLMMKNKPTKSKFKGFFYKEPLYKEPEAEVGVDISGI